MSSSANAVSASVPASASALPRAGLDLRVRALGVAAGVAFVLSAWAIGGVLDTAVFLALFVAFTLPGWPIANWLTGRRAPWLVTGPLALLLGYVCGFTAFLLVRLAFPGAPLFVLLVTVGLAVVLQVSLPSSDDGALDLPAFDWRDAAAVSVLLLAAAAIIGPVFANVGRETPQGLAYRAYFIADLFAHMSVVGELLKPSNPPINPYFPTEALPYYWSFFTLPTVVDSVREWLRGPFGVERGILLTDLVMGGVYVSVWFLALRSFRLSALASTLALLMVLIASSFEGLWFLLGNVPGARTFESFRFINVDAVTRWVWDLPPVDGLHRLLWYTPQHGMAITLGMTAMLVSATARRADGVWRGLVDGLLLGGALACSSFNGLLIIGGYALAETWRLARGRFAGVAPWIAARAIAATIVGVFLALTLVMQMVGRGNGGELVLRWNPHFLRGPWIFLALSFGPALFIAPFGLRRLVSQRPQAVVSAVALSLVALAAFLYVDIRGHDNTYVSFRTGQIWFLVLAMFVAAAIDAARAWRPALRTAAGALVLLAVLAALPTVALDAYNARDIDNGEMSVGGFPWTVHIDDAQEAAAAWIAGHVPENAIVQTDASSRGRATWAFIPAFAKRRLAVGLGLFEPNPRRFDADIARVRTLFRSPDANQALDICNDLRIDYVYVGPEERAAHGPAVDKFRTAPSFTVVYDRDGVTIYRVHRTVKAPAAAGGRGAP